MHLSRQGSEKADNNLKSSKKEYKYKLRTFLRETEHECPQMFTITGPVRPFEVFFTGPKLFFGVFTGLGPVVHC